MADDDKKKQAPANNLPPVIIKKIKKVEGGHHGGAWKVAYADFVTAMMAFFLLLWLLNVSTQEQLNGIADYFRPTSVSDSTSGSGGVMGGLTIAPEGQMTSEVTPVGVDTDLPGEDDKDDTGTPTPEELERARAEEEQKQFDEAAKQLQQAIEEDPSLQDIANNLIVDMTPEGLRIQIVDQKGKSMFPSGKADMYDNTYRLMSKVAGVIEKLPNKISVRGHTDSVPYGAGADYNNWDLSADRANASRRALTASGLNPERIKNVVGKADTDHLFVDDPTSPQNRRISIILLRNYKLYDEGSASSEEEGKPFNRNGTPIWER